jgi:tRNA (mo5U34)-methyltransferase
MSSAELLQLVNRYYWFHSLDLGHGVVTPGGKTLDIHRAEYSAFFDPVELKGRTVIDIGTWDGAYSFEAKRRGASRVLATDHFVWKHYNRETFNIARSALNLDIEALDIDVPELSPERVGTFDVVLFLGVFYHLFDPIAGLANAAKLAREVLIVETHIESLETHRPAMVFFPGAELNNDPTNWWGPNPAMMVTLLKSLGFTKVDAAWSLKDGSRAVFHAWRSESLRKHLGEERAIAISTISNFSRLKRKFARLWRQVLSRPQ